MWQKCGLTSVERIKRFSTLDSDCGGRADEWTCPEGDADGLSSTDSGHPNTSQCCERPLRFGPGGMESQAEWNKVKNTIQYFEQQPSI